MRKILFLFFVWLYPIFSFGGINECLTDIYFVNGIRSDEGNATANTLLLEESIRIDLYGDSEDKMYKHIGKVKEAYNSTHGFGWDGIETYMQKFGAQWILDLFFSTAHKADLKKQIKKYKTSIRDGHRVLVVAHSQGNLFANDAYKKILGHKTDWWMTPYMSFVSVASPNCFKITPSTPGVSWDNDIVPNLVDICSADSVDNDVRRVYWTDTKVALVTDPPVSSYVWKSQVGDLLHDDWQSYEPTFQSSIAVHAFTFYMGESLGGKGKEIPNGYDGSEMNATRAKTKIMTAIEAQLNDLEELCNNNTDNSNDNNNSTGGDNDGSDNSAIDFNFKTDCNGIEFPDPIPDTFKQQIEKLIPEKVTKDMVDQICKQIKDIVDSIPDIPDGVPTGGGVPKIN